MCGIFGVVGEDRSYHEIKTGLERLSYRGYDSAGIACVQDGQFVISKTKGHPENLVDSLIESTIGIGHDRWSTHSAPTKDNAHPYLSNNGRIALVHNGIIENYPEVRKFLKKKGFSFQTDTDTEVIPNLIEYYSRHYSIQVAIRRAIKKIRGAYAVAFLHLDYPETIFVVRHHSPICIGIADGKHYISSDNVSLPRTVHEVITVDNDKIAVITKDNVSITSFNGEEYLPEIHPYDNQEDAYDLGDYSCYLEKEIFEQPLYMRNAISGRICLEDHLIKLAGISEHIETIRQADEIIFIGCGSAFLAAQVASRAMEDIGRVKSRAMNAGELQYQNPVITERTVIVAISQSGETADTLGCIKVLKDKAAAIIGIVNVVGSNISKKVDSGIYIRAGREISVASSKALTNMIINCLMMAYLVGKDKISHLEYETFIQEIQLLPSLFEKVLSTEKNIEILARQFATYENMLCIGRGSLETIALEGALKIKELSYVHAEGYSAAELKHGPLALVCPDILTIALVGNNLLGQKMLGNIKEVITRDGPILSVMSTASEEIENISTKTFHVPNMTNIYLQGILYLGFLQLLSYHLAKARGCEIDRPRNLSKSVTVE
jgi:glutamine---fructose-6-phosphate transaminase (isomerizing)